MKKIFLLPFLFLLYSCSLSDKMKQQDVPQIITDQLKLTPKLKIKDVAEFVFVSPKNKAENIEGNVPLTFLWKKPIFSLQNPQEARKLLEENIKIKPEIQGTWMLLGSTGISFQPDTSWALSSEYKLIFNPQISKILEYSFKTKPIEITNLNSQNLVDKNPLILTFNQPVLSGVKDLIEIKNSETSEIFNFFEVQYGTIKDEDGNPRIQKNMLEIKPLKPWIEGESFSLKILPGKWSVDGNLLLERSFEKQFKTLPNFGIEEFDLPKKHNDNLRIQFSSPVNPKIFAENLIIEPQLTPKKWEAFTKQWTDLNESYATQYFYVSSPTKIWNPAIKYNVRINPDIKDIFGRNLNFEKPPVRNFLTVMDDIFRPIFMPQSNSVFEKKSPLQPSFFYAGSVDKVKVIFHPIGENIKRDRFTKNASEISPPITISQKLRKESFSKGSEKIFELEPSKKRINTWNLDLRKEFPQFFDKNGDFIPNEYILDIQSHNQKKGWQYNNRINFFISEFSVELKKLAKGGFQIFAQAYPQKLELTKLFDVDLYQGTWGKKWHWKKILGLKNGDILEMDEKEQQNFKTIKVTTLDGLIGFGSTQFNKGIYGWDAKVDINQAAYREKFSGSVFTDRPLYKTGQKVFIKGYVREKNNFGKVFPLKDVTPNLNYTCEIKIKNPQYQDIKENIKCLIDNGEFFAEFDIPKDSMLGQYSFEIVISENTHDKNKKILRLYKNFWVQTYRKPKILIFKKFDKKHAVLETDIKAEIQGKYAFGGDLSNAEVDYTLSLFGNEICAFYCWGEPNRKDKLVKEGKTKLNENGKLILPINLQNLDIKKDENWNLLTLNATVSQSKTEKSGFEISVPFFMSEFQIELDSNPYFYEPDSLEKISGKVIDLEKNLQKNTKIKATLYQKEWVRNDRKNPNGNFYGEWHSVDTKIKDYETETDDLGLFSLDFQTPQEGGQYFIEFIVQDLKERVFKLKHSFWISGSEMKSVRYDDKNKILNIFSDKDKYGINDTIEIFTPIPNFKITRSHITLERGEILETLDFDKTKNTVSFSPEDWMVPNVFVSILLEGIDDKGKFQVRWGTIKINIEDGQHDLDIKITPEKEVYKPGSLVKLNIQTSVAGKPVSGNVAVAIVDQTLLALKSREKMNLKKDLLGSLPLGVEVFHSLANFYSVQEMKDMLDKSKEMLRSVSESSFGGGGGKGRSFKPRGDFKDTAYFTQKVQTDEKGKATLEFKIPDNLTTWNILGVGATDKNAFGETESDFKVNLPLLISEIVPQYFQAGDTINIGLSLHRDDNEIKKEKITVKINLPEGFVSKDGIEKIIEVEKESQAFFEVQVPISTEKNCKQSTKSCSVKFGFEIEAQTSKLKDKIILERKLIPALKSLSVSEFLNSKELLAIKTDKKSLKSELKVRVIASLLQLAEPLLKQAERFNYGSVDQSFTNTTLEMYRYRILQALDKNKKTTQISQKSWGKVKLLTEKSFKNGGGFGYFETSDLPSVWVTINILENLDIWKSFGFNFPENQIQESFSWLKRKVLNPCENNNFCLHDTTRQQAAFLLAKAEKLNINDFLFLGKYTKSFESKVWWIKTSFLIKNLDPESQMMQEDFLEILNQKAIIRDSYIFWEESNQCFYCQKERMTALIFELMIDQGFLKELKFKVARYLSETSPKYFSGTTSLSVFKALKSYNDTLGKPNLKNIFEIIVEERKSLENSIQKQSPNALLSKELDGNNKILISETINSPKDNFSASSILEPKSYILKTKSENPLLLQVMLEETFKSEDIENLNRGFWIESKIEKLNLNAPQKDIKQKEKPSLNVLEQGGLYKVTLDIVTRSSHRNVVVESPIISGAEIVNFDLDNSNNRLKDITKNNRGGCFWGWCQPTFERKEFHEDKAQFFIEYMPAGTHRITYILKPRLTGSFEKLPTTVREIYYPEIFAQTKGKRIKIQ